MAANSMTRNTSFDDVLARLHVLPMLLFPILNPRIPRADSIWKLPTVVEVRVHSFRSHKYSGAPLAICLPMSRHPQRLSCSSGLLEGTSATEETRGVISLQCYAGTVAAPNTDDLSSDVCDRQMSSMTICEVLARAFH